MTDSLCNCVGEKVVSIKMKNGNEMIITDIGIFVFIRIIKMI